MIPGFETPDSIGRVIFSRGQELGAGAQAFGTLPNPFAPHCKEWQRRKENGPARMLLTHKIESLFEPRFITPPETSELIESIVTATDSRRVLELGMYSGFTSLHILRALVGKENAKLVSVDCRPCHDREFFADFTQYFEHITGWTPQCLDSLKGQLFDLVFIDSDHTVEHCERERQALIEITRPGSVWIFHDVPKWTTPDNRVQPPVRDWLDKLVREGFLAGHPLQTCEQLDNLHTFGPGYAPELNPHLGIFTRL